MLSHFSGNHRIRTCLIIRMSYHSRPLNLKGIIPIPLQFHLTTFVARECDINLNLNHLSALNSLTTVKLNCFYKYPVSKPLYLIPLSSDVLILYAFFLNFSLSVILVLSNIDTNLANSFMDSNTFFSPFNII